ncbi:NADPH oxidase 4 [Pelomyxa schiedti]|nr:NADPH oxidase 4 [Pelomyxa schiedti]
MASTSTSTGTATSTARDDILEVAAMGRRGIEVGYCYDARSDRFWRVSLWNTSSLASLRPVPEASQKVKVTIERDLSDRLDELDVSAELKLSLCAGMIDVSGSAHFLNKQLVSTNTARVVFTINVITHWIGLTMDQLGQDKDGRMLFDQTQVFDNQDLTHVVSQITYGVNGHFVFDVVSNDSKERREIEGKLDVMIKKIPLCDISGKASLNLTEEESTLSDRISVDYVGDLILDAPPTTFEAALHAVGQFTSEKILHSAVPLKVQLMPLSKLMPNTVRICHKIRSDIIQSLMQLQGEIERVIVNLHALKMDNAETVPPVTQALTTLESAAKDLKAHLQEQLLAKIPLVRGDGTGREETALLDLYTSITQSAFQPHYLQSYADNLHYQVKVLNQVIQEANASNSEGQPDLHIMSLHGVKSSVSGDFIVLKLSVPFTTDYMQQLSKRPLTFTTKIPPDAPIPSPVKWEEDPPLLAKLVESCKLVHREAAQCKLKPIFCLESTDTSPHIEVSFRRGMTWRRFEEPPTPRNLVIRQCNVGYQVTWDSVPVQTPPLGAVSYRLDGAPWSSASNFQQWYFGPNCSYLLYRGQVPAHSKLRLCSVMQATGEASDWVCAEVGQIRLDPASANRGVVLEPDGLGCTIPGTPATVVAATEGFISGSHCWEFTLEETEQWCHVGVCCSPSSVTSGTNLGSMSSGFAIMGCSNREQGSMFLWHNGQGFEDGIRVFLPGDRVRLTLDCAKGTLEYCINGNLISTLVFRGKLKECCGRAPLFPAFSSYRGPRPTKFTKISFDC